ncbi:MAG: DUF47 family protein [Sphingobacteriales bacterium]|jgi:uncharacterized protein Yka (UPF0111/DUF47 family)|nr:DUF47 family protein [Sphingobacteriales bacterium]
MGLFGTKDEKDDKFILQLIEQSQKTHSTIVFLEHSLDDDNASKIEHIKNIIGEIEEIRRVLIDDLHNTFITPIDREDIYNISNALAGMVDYSLTTVEEMHILKVVPDEYIRKMITLVRRQTEELLAAMERLSKNPRVAGEHTFVVKTLEKEVEHLYRKAVRDLFNTPIDLNTLGHLFFKREVYRHISNMSDRAEAAANVFGMVVMKLS